jgi:hypothetical protein
MALKARPAMAAIMTGLANVVSCAPASAQSAFWMPIVRGCPAHSYTEPNNR